MGTEFQEGRMGTYCIQCLSCRCEFEIFSLTEDEFWDMICIECQSERLEVTSFVPEESADELLARIKKLMLN